MAQFAPGILGVAFFVFWMWALLDVALTDKTAFRRMNKTFWFLIVALASSIGAVGWLLLGRPKNAGFTPGAKLSRPNFLNRPPGPRGPEDYADWNASTAPSLPADQILVEAEPDFSTWEAEFEQDDSEDDEA